jgi:hypothetical protein
MKLTNIPTPELALLSITRVAIGAGVGFLLGHRLDREFRRGLGIALIGVGAALTIPLAIDVIRRTRNVEKLHATPEMPAMPGVRPNTREGALAH